MNKYASHWTSFLAVAAAVLFSMSQTFAQTDASGSSNIVLSVGIRAAIPVASEPGNHPGMFTIFRTLPATDGSSLRVAYAISGTASNGIDYIKIPAEAVVIPPGALSTNLMITPVEEPGASQPKTVTLTLRDLAGAPIMALSNSATVTIVYNYSNLPPVVSIVAPADGSSFTTPTNILIAASASDPDGTVQSVEFFANGNSLGLVRPPNPAPANPVSWIPQLLWSNAPAGNYALTAVATDNSGVGATSSPVNVTIKGQTTNLPPTVRITSPASGAFFPAPANILIAASASDPDGWVKTLEFFSGSNSLGVLTFFPPWIMAPQPAPQLLWTNVPAGEYVLTVVATDDGGAAATSAPVRVTVQKTSPPPTNIPPVVRIVSPANRATFRAPVNIPIFAYASDVDDPVASVEFFAGTNSLGLGKTNLTVLNDSGALVGGAPVRIPGNTYSLAWSNVPPGSYPLTALATDSRGASRTSEAINITVLPPPPPPSNTMPVVTIVATDPIAIEGTNCFSWLGIAASTPTWSNWVTAIPQPFTNCGPKYATIALRRAGSADADLNVAYEIGGTASNGVDYVSLPGSATIPAGERTTLITIVPIDDGILGDLNKTVVLKLKATASAPPAYIVGSPNSAAAIIVDSIQPRPLTGLLKDNTFHIAAAGPDGAWFHIDYSTNLINWIPLCTNQVFNGSIDFVDPDAPANVKRFYRTASEANPPE